MKRHCGRASCAKVEDACKCSCRRCDKARQWRVMEYQASGLAWLGRFGWIFVKAAQYNAWVEQLPATLHEAARTYHPWSFWKVSDTGHHCRVVSLGEREGDDGPVGLNIVLWDPGNPRDAMNATNILPGDLEALA